MTFPSIVLGVLISTLPGALFHLWKGGGPGKLLLYILLGWIGFWAGVILGTMMGLVFWTIGPLNVGMGLIGSLLFLGGGYWLSLIQAE